jgi:hypothetical protein
MQHARITMHLPCTMRRRMRIVHLRCSANHALELNQVPLAGSDNGSYE